MENMKRDGWGVKMYVEECQEGGESIRMDDTICQMPKIDYTQSAPCKEF